MNLPLPTWVIELVAAIERSEEEHPRYFGDFHDGIKPLDGCPESRFLGLVPDDVRATARRWDVVKTNCENCADTGCRLCNWAGEMCDCDHALVEHLPYGGCLGGGLDANCDCEVARK